MPSREQTVVDAVRLFEEAEYSSGLSASNECPVYKAAYERIYRQARREHLLYYVVTNEYAPARLNKMLDDPCVDGVVHVHKKAPVEVCGLDGRLVRLMDLEDFINATFSW